MILLDACHEILDAYCALDEISNTDEQMAFSPPVITSAQASVFPSMHPKQPIDHDDAEKR